MDMDFEGLIDDAADRFLSRTRCRLVHNELEHHPFLIDFISDILREHCGVTITYSYAAYFDFMGWGWNIPPRVTGGEHGSVIEIDSWR